VYDAVLTEPELMARLPQGITGTDSARFAEQYVRSWVSEQALLRLAEDNLSPEQKDFTAQLEEYRRSLLLYAYERAYLLQKLDTVVTDTELESYYEAHKDNFRLRSPVVKLRFVKLSPEAPRIRDVERWLRSDRESDFDELYNYCRKYAENYFFEQGTWLYLEEVMKELPLPADDISNFLRQNTYYSFTSGDYLYLVRIFDFKLKEEIAPMVLERRRVRDFILNRRRTELLSGMRDQVVSQGIATRNIYIKTQ
jgi:hypothetical protein